MFKAAKAGPQKAVTGNRLSDGRVVFLTESGDWSLAVADARLATDGPDLDAALAYGKAQQDAHIIVDPYAIDIAIVDGKPVPSRLRERIRAEGPTIPYGKGEREKLTARV